MHLGLARTALLGWLRARSLGGEFVVRIEDLDAPRTVPGTAERLLDELRFLGLDWDEGPDIGGPFAPYVQSQRLARYAEALAQLRANGALYRCSCSRKEVAIASAPHGPSEFGALYPGTCRDGPARPDQACSLRFRAPDELPTFDDALLGPVEPSATGDFVLQRADGVVSYQLAVVVDDLAMQVTEVLRGADLAGCTGWQIALYGALGATPPRFVHVPLLLGPDGKRLAKRAGARPISALREAGLSAETIVGALAASVGLVPPGVRVAARELVADFALDRVVESAIDLERAFGSER
jgi:glutamyl-tRNA synthetase